MLLADSKVYKKKIRLVFINELNVMQNQIHILVVQNFAVSRCEFINHLATLSTRF